MPDLERKHLSWLFVALLAVSGIALLAGGPTVIASDDHDRVQALRAQGDIVPLAELLQRNGLSDSRVIEAELEREYGTLVYELELLNGDGRVQKRYFDATTAEPLSGYRDR